MSNEFLDYVEDMLDAIDKAELLVLDVTYDQFADDFRINFAVVRTLEIIGHSASQSSCATAGNPNCCRSSGVRSRKTQHSLASSISSSRDCQMLKMLTGPSGHGATMTWLPLGDNWATQLLGNVKLATSVPEGMSHTLTLPPLSDVRRRSCSGNQLILPSFTPLVVILCSGSPVAGSQTVMIPSPL